MNPEFSIHDVQHQASHMLFLAGELEITNAPILPTVVTTLRTDGASEIVLDVGELRLIDSTGLGSILRSRAVCQEFSCEFGLTRGAQRTQRIFELTGLDKEFSSRGEAPSDARSKKATMAGSSRWRSPPTASSCVARRPASAANARARRVARARQVKLLGPLSETALWLLKSHPGSTHDTADSGL